MKKMFTLFAGLFMSIALFAADRRPSVMLNNYSHQYKVVIDGRAYFGDNIRVDIDNNYGYGNNYGNKQIHTVKVYEMRQGFFQRERLIDAATFYLGNRDMVINVDRFGSVRVQEFRNRGRNGRDRRDDNHWDGNDDRNDRNDPDRNDRENRF